MMRPRAKGNEERMVSRCGLRLLPVWQGRLRSEVRILGLMRAKRTGFMTMMKILIKVLNNDK